MLATLAGMLASCVGTPSPRTNPTPTPLAEKPRVVVTTDPELDDSNSLLRYLLFSTDFRTEGLVYWKGDGTGKTWFVPNREYRRFGLQLCPCTSWRWAPGERFIDDAVEIYGQVYPNLRVHRPDYPTPAELKSKIRWGNVEFDGDISKDSGPLFLLAWGGESTIARALKSIEEQYQGTSEWPRVRDKVSRKAVLSPSGDQDDTYASYIRPHWPLIRTLPAGVGGVGLAYGAGTSASAENAVYYSADWTRDNVSTRGPLGAHYRVWGDGKQMVANDIFDYFGIAGQSAEELRAKGYAVWLPPRPKGEFLGEGDTFTYLNLLDNGLLGWHDDTPGGWAGRGARPVSPNPNFTPAAQNAFAARMKWSVTPTYAGANHEPIVWLRRPARVSVRPGEEVRLEGATSDPDGNAVSVRWRQWREVGSYPGRVAISDSTALAARVRVPADAAAGQTIQLVLEATDDGASPLTSYQRVIVTVAR